MQTCLKIEYYFTLIRKISAIFSKEEGRYHIEALIRLGYKQIDIAKELGVHPSTINRELQRNKFKGKYKPVQAQAEYILRQKKKRKRSSISKSLHHETIYQFIYRNKTNGESLYRHLRHKNKKYHSRSNKYDKRCTIICRVMIDERPSIVDKKS